MEVTLVYASEAETACFKHILRSCVIDAHLSEDHIGAGLDDLGDSALKNVALLLSDFLKIFWVVNQHLDA